MSRDPQSQEERDILFRAETAKRKSLNPALGATTRAKQASNFKRQCKKLLSKGVCLKCAGLCVP